MMICPETFYENELKGKTIPEIMTVIRGLKNEIGRLKNIMEHPKYVCTIHPSEDVRISCYRDYLEKAKEALAEVGGIYQPSKAELRAKNFDDNIAHINKIVFTIGGFFQGHETRTFTVCDDKVYVNVEHSMMLPPSNIEDCQIEPFDKEEFLDSLRYVHIGEWRTRYDPSRFGYVVLDGTQWELEICFSSEHKPIRISGSNAYPYNFDRLMDVLDIENWRDENEE